MSSYEIITIIVSCLSALISIAAMLATYLPYIVYKIKFEVSLTPYVVNKDDFDIRFEIINKRKEDLHLECLCARKEWDLQAFSDKDYPKIIKANSSKIFTISNAKLKFDTSRLSDYIKSERKKKLPKYIVFYFIDSIRKEHSYKIRYKDYLNLKEFFELNRKLQDKTITPSEIERYVLVMGYAIKKNKAFF